MDVKINCRCHVFWKHICGLAMPEENLKFIWFKNSGKLQARYKQKSPVIIILFTSTIITPLPITPLYDTKSNKTCMILCTDL